MSANFAREAAQRYLELGWTPIPLRPTPSTPKGIPPKGTTGFSADPTKLTASSLLALEWRERNVALRLPGDVIGIDVDVYNGGDIGLAELVAKYGPLPPTYYTHNGRRDGSGIRLYRVPMGSTFASNPAQGIDVIQWCHRYAIVSPSGHPEGRLYAWYDEQGDEPVDLPPEPGELPDLPWSWQTGLSAPRSASRAERTASSQEVAAFLDEHTANARPGALDELLERLTTATSRHDTAVAVAARGFREAAAGWYPARTFVERLEQWWRQALADNPRRRDSGELAAILSWAVAEVGAEPEAVEQLARRAQAETIRVPDGRDVAVASGHEPGDLVRESCSGVDGYRYTDLGNARRLIDAHRDHLRFVPKWRRWLVYDRGRWRVDDADTLARHLASRIGAGLLTTEHFATIKADPDPARQKARMEALIRWAQRSENRSGVDGTIAAAASLPGVAIHHDALDADPWVLNCRNGTLELRTGRLRRHDPADLLTLMADVDYDPEADAQQFDRFLAEVLPDEQVRRFVQRLAGVVLVGEQIEHVLPIALGGGANGKSSLTQIVAAVLGDYAVAAAPDLLLAARQDTHPTTRATLFRRRFAHSGELPPGAKVDEAQVKRLTGGDAISARRMREDEWQFVPSHTLWLHANHRPSIAGTDEGIWRRVVLIPFDVAIPPERRDPHLAERIIRDESAGVLRWMIDGLRDYLEVGLAPPAAVTIATTDYRSQSDTARRFLDDVSATFDPDRWTSAGDLMTVHSEWFRTAGAVGHGTEAAHYQLVTTLLKSQGCSNGRSRTRGGGYWQGVGLDD